MQNQKVQATQNVRYIRKIRLCILITQQIQ